MSDEVFASKNVQLIPASQPAVVVGNDEDIRFALELAEVAGDPGFLGIIAKQVKWNISKKAVPIIKTEEQMSQSVDLFDEMGKALKGLEAIRLINVAFPTKVVRLINGMFKQVRDNIEMSKGHVGKLIRVRQGELTREAERKRAKFETEQRRLTENDQVAEASTEEVEGGEINKMNFDPSLPPELPDNTVSSTKGAKVHIKADLGVEVTCLFDFLKFMVSKQTRNAWLTGELAEVVQINVPALKRILKKNPTKKRVGGLKIEKIERVV